MSSFSLPDDFFAKKALVALCLLGNNSEIKTIVLLNTGAIRYSFVDPAITHCVCNKLEIKPI